MKYIKRFFLFAVLALSSICASAYDFKEVNGDGVTIYYNITSESDLTCEVTRRSSGSSNSDAYSGVVVIPETASYLGNTYSVVAIGTDAFQYCSNLTEVTIPNSVTSIGMGAFDDCSSLTSVNIPNGVTLIGQMAFSSCSSLTSVTIPNSVTTIEYGAFSQCKSLTNITIPNSVTSIGRNAFYKCSGLTSVTIGNSVTSIESSTFYDCSKLMSITSLNPEAPTCNGSNYFYNVPTSTCVLYVPLGATKSYSEATGWKDFFNIEEIEEVVIAPTVQTNTATNVDVTSATLNGTVTQGSEEITEQGFEYWVTEDDVKIVVATENMTITLTDLTAGTTYTYKAYAKTASDTYYGEEKTFTTSIIVPTVQTISATDITYNSATLNATIEAGTEEILESGFEYWISSSDKTTVEAAGENISAVVENLSSGTTYTYRAYAYTESGYTYGESLTFTTLFDSDSAEEELSDDIDDAQDKLEEVWDEIEKNYSDVADDLKDEYDSLTDELNKLLEELEDAYKTGTLTEDLANEIREEINEILQRIEDLLKEADDAQANFNLYTTLTDEIDSEKAELEEIWETIEKDYSDVVDEFKEDNETIKEELDSLLKELEDAYNNGALDDKLADEIRTKLEDISKEIDNLLASAKQADNDNLHDGLTKDIKDAQDKLEEVWDEIEKNYSDVADDFKDDYDKLKEELNDLLAESEDAYNNGTLDDELADEIKDNLDDILDSIEDLLKGAQTAGINSIFSNLGDDIQIYTLSGTRVNTPQKDGIYIFKYADATAKKVLVK